MANDVNQCNFIGRLGSDPDSRFLPNGKAVVNMRLAVGSQWNDQAGNKQERTEWVPVVVFGKLAEICDKFLLKGSQIYVSGRFQTREWEKDGVKRYSSEIVADTMQILSSRKAHGDVQQRSEGRRGEGGGQQQNSPHGGLYDQTTPADVIDDFEDLPY